MPGLSVLERIVYFEVLKIPAGFVSQWYDPMSRLFNIIFLPGIAWIIFLHFATKPFSRFGKGLVGLLSVGITVFGISNGFFGIWAQFAQTWFFILVGISAFFFVMETFITKSAMHNIVKTASYGLGGGTGKYKRAMKAYTHADAVIKKYDTELQAISSEITALSNQASNLTITLATADSSARAHIQNQINQINSRIRNLQDQYQKLAKKRADAVAKLAKAEGSMKQFESIHPDRISG